MLGQELRTLSSGRARSRRLRELAILGLNFETSNLSDGTELTQAEIAERLSSIDLRLVGLTELTKSRGYQDVASARKVSDGEDAAHGVARKRFGMKGQFAKMADEKDIKH